MRISIAGATALALCFVWSAVVAQTDDEQNHDMKVVFVNKSGSIAYVSGDDEVAIQNNDQGEAHMKMEGCAGNNQAIAFLICLDDEDCENFIAAQYFGSKHSDGTCYLKFGGINWDLAQDLEDDYSFTDKATNDAHKRDLTMKKSE